MSTLFSTLIVAAVSLVGFIKAIPVGFSLQLDIYLLATAAAAGSIVSVMFLYGSGIKLKERILGKKKKEKLSRRTGKLRRVYDRYGLIGISFIGTVSLGPQLTLLVGLGLTRYHKKFLAAVLISIVFWSVSLTAVSAFGIDAVREMLANF